MALLRRIPRASWVALAAIAGLLLAAEDASACAAKGTSAKIRSCCISRPANECGCCSSTTPLTSTGTAIAGFARFERTLPIAQLPAPTYGSPCECRSSVPTEPAPAPSRNSVEQRTEQRRAELSVPPVTHDRPSASFAAIDLQCGDLPQFPLSLRTTRLLI
jgi:hypothetical protein